MSNIIKKIQNIKLQLKNMDILFDNLILQIQNKEKLSIGKQVYNISIQTFDLGIQMLNIVKQLPKMKIDFFNTKQQIQYFGKKIQNIGNQFPGNSINMKIPIFNRSNIEMPSNTMINLYRNNEVEENEINTNNNEEITQKINITFKTAEGEQDTIVFNYGTTISDILKRYLNKINHPEFIKKGDNIVFLYNAKKLKFRTKIEKFFNNTSIPVIKVIQGSL